MSTSSSINRHPPSALRRRLRWQFATFIALSLTVYIRLIALELKDGPEYRAIAAEPIVRMHSVPSIRGRILAADGTVLAYDHLTVGLAVHYRWLEEPVNPRWLRQMSRSRLSAFDRRDPRRVASAQQQVLAQRRELARQLASLCGITQEQWIAREGQIQQQVCSIAAGVNARLEAR